MNDSKRKEFEHLTEINSIDQWARDLPRLNNQEFLKEWKNFEQLDRLSTGSQKQYISN